MYKLVLIAVVLATATVRAVDFEIRNRDGGHVWIGIQGNPGKPPLEGGGFVLASKQSRTISAPGDWAGRFWSRTWCNASSNHCLTGDCGNTLHCGGNSGAPPASLVEITLRGAYGLDYYDISLVDGFNALVAVEPVGGSGDGSRNSCKKTSCTHHFNSDCPNELKLNTQHGVVGCKSACAAFNTDQYCCRNGHGSSKNCKPLNWPVNYQAHFKSKCPNAISYAFDINNTIFTCKAKKYIITFGG